MQNPISAVPTKVPPKVLKASYDVHAVLCAVQALITAENRMDTTATSILTLTHIGKKKLEKLWR